MARSSSPRSAVVEVALRRIRRDGLIPAGSAVLVACSGGADSTALFDILLGQADEGGFRMGVIHVDHGQHPDSARIAKRVRARCRRLGVPIHLHRLDPARLPPGSPEAALREARYRIFRRVAERVGYDRIATGHSASDQAETVLMRLARGTGPAGLAGIPSLRDGLFIRPLLDLERAQILAYLRSRRLRWDEDPTNSDPGLLRNRLRHQVLPLLREAVNPAVDRALVRLSQAAERDERALAGMAAQVDLETSPDGGLRVSRQLLDSLPEAVQARVLTRMVTGLAGPGVRLEQHHLNRLLRRLATGGAFRLGLQAGLEAIARTGWLRLGWIEPPARGVATAHR